MFVRGLAVSWTSPQGIDIAWIGVGENEDYMVPEFPQLMDVCQLDDEDLELGKLRLQQHVQAFDSYN